MLQDDVFLEVLLLVLELSSEEAEEVLIWISQTNLG